MGETGLLLLIEKHMYIMYYPFFLDVESLEYSKNFQNLCYTNHILLIRLFHRCVVACIQTNDKSPIFLFLANSQLSTIRVLEFILIEVLRSQLYSSN